MFYKILFTALAFCFLLSSVNAQCTPAVATLESGEPAPVHTTSDFFGTSMATDSSVCVVGAFFHDGIPGGPLFINNMGAAYVFRNDGTDWSLEQKLTASNAQMSGHFGLSVAIDGNVIAVAGGILGSSPPGNLYGNHNAVYIYRNVGGVWIEEQELVPSDPATHMMAGGRVSISGDLVAYSLPNSDGVQSSSGSVFIFRHNAGVWVEEQKLTASDGQSGDSFGSSLKLFGNQILIGAPAADHNGVDSGSAYLFEYNGSDWIEMQKLISSSPAPDSFFGTSVSLGSETLAVSSPGPISSATNSGGVYVYRLHGSGWELEDNLLPSDAETGDSFGYSVSVLENSVLVGAPHYNVQTPQLGSAYLYTFGDGAWHEIEQFDGIDNGSNFGSSVSLSSTMAAISAPWSPWAGKVYANELCKNLDFIRADCNQDSLFDLADAIVSLNVLFGDLLSTCPDACDFNDDGAMDVADAIGILSQLFSGGVAPSTPYPNCGEDLTFDTLGCNSFASCP